VSVVCRQVEVPATGRSLAQRSLTECGMCECDRGNSKVRRPWFTKGCRAMKRIPSAINLTEIQSLILVFRLVLVYL